MTIEKVCKDCKQEFIDGITKKIPKRPALEQGPRCTTHWRAEVRRRKAANHEKRVQNTYGLEKGEYAQLYEFQLGHCAICRRATGASRKLSVDHDHATGAVRGLLCRPCNTMLGHSRDREDFFERAQWYLRTPPFWRMKEGMDFRE